MFFGNEKKRPLKEVVEILIMELVDFPKDVKIKEVMGDQTLIIEVSVHDRDVGRILGKQGKTIDSIRTLVYCLAARQKIRCSIQINQ